MNCTDGDFTKDWFSDFIVECINHINESAKESQIEENFDDFDF